VTIPGPDESARARRGSGRQVSSPAVRTRVQEARELLKALGMDDDRSNERSALVLLALLRLRPGDPWSSAANPMLGTRAIMDWIRSEYEKDYAPNTRETVRRFTLHQFEEAHLVVENPDEPGRPKNSPKWNYQVKTRPWRSFSGAALLSTSSRGAWLDTWISCRA
jgi:hypothetical protein